MPSFIVHCVAGNELSKRLELNEDDSRLFFLANLLPDATDIDTINKLDDIEARRVIQTDKMITHFRTTSDVLLMKPNLDFFLNKYKKYIKNDLVVFAYFFHLYTDYYYFTYFLPKMITFVDDNDNEVSKKSLCKYIILNKSKRKLLRHEFWGKSNIHGIYGEYNRLNNYLINKYNLSFNYDDIIKAYPFKCIIEEANYRYVELLLKELSSFFNNSKMDDFEIFNTDDVDSLIDDIIDSFIRDYSDIIYKSNK